MAFPNQTPRVFNEFNVKAINPNQLGVYGIFRDGQWIYVGQGDIRARLLAHLNGDNSRILAAGPTHWVDEVCMEQLIDVREKQLILELAPLCNQKVG